MQSTLTPQETDPHDTFLIEPDVVLATRGADHALPDPVHDALSRLAHRAAQATPGVSVGAPRAAAGSAAAAIPTVDTTFRAAAVGASTKLPGQRSAFARWAKNAFIAFLFALCSAIAAQTWRHHSDTIKQMVASRMPPFVLALMSPAATPAPAEQPDAAPVETATAVDQAPPAQPSPSPDAVAPAPAPTAATTESTPAAPSPSVQSMASDIAAMSQQIDQLKASIEQLKAGQAQMSRDIAKASEQNLRARVATLPPRPVAAAPVRKPKPAYPPAQQAAATSSLPPPSAAAPALPQPAPMPPPQATVESDGGPVVRPPMPLQ
jgi:TolA-binding protein